MGSGKAGCWLYRKKNATKITRRARVRREINITRASEALLWTVPLASHFDTVLLLSLRFHILQVGASLLRQNAKQ